jgi:hypothetical protein
VFFTLWDTLGEFAQHLVKAMFPQVSSLLYSTVDTALDADEQPYVADLECVQHDIKLDALLTFLLCVSFLSLHL